MRKEYNDRWNAPLVNPGFTLEQYEAQKIKARQQRLGSILDGALKDTDDLQDLSQVAKDFESFVSQAD
jgi:hypothetical protein